MDTVLKNLSDGPISLDLRDEMYNSFLLFDETVRHIELCNSIISHIQLNLAKLF